MPLVSVLQTRSSQIFVFNARLTDIIGSFRNGNADVRLCVSCENFGSWHSYELETLRNPRIHNRIVAKNRILLEAPTQLKD